MFKAIWVRIGRSASATLTQSVLHPVASIEADNRTASKVLNSEFEFIMRISFVVLAIWIYN
jgi:hypothetical protein